MDNSLQKSFNNPPRVEVKKKSLFKENIHFWRAGTLLKRGIVLHPFILEDIIAMYLVTIIAGSSATGKSSWLRQLAMAIVSGKTEFIGRKINAPNKSVIIVTTEDNNSSLSVLLKPLQDDNKEDDFNSLFFIELDSNYLEIAQSIIDSNGPIDLIIIDALGDILKGDVNMSSVVRTQINKIKRFAAKNKCAIILNHHISKESENKPPNKSSLLGSMAIEAVARQIIVLNKDVHNEDQRNLYIVKSNLLPPKVQNKVIQLEFKDLRFRNTNEDNILLDDITKSASKQKLDIAIKEVYDHYSKGMDYGNIYQRTGVHKSQIRSYVEKYEAKYPDKIIDREAAVTAWKKLQKKEEEFEVLETPADSTNEFDLKNPLGEEE